MIQALRSDTGLFDPEYVNIFGVPFTFLPHESKDGAIPTPPKPKTPIEPDPAKLLQAQVTVPGILDAVAKSNMIDSPGLLENNHELSLALVSNQTRTPDEIGNIVLRTTPAGIGMHSARSPCRASTSSGKPRDSAPNSRQSPAW